MTYTLRTFKDKTFLEESSHRRYDTALKALMTRDGDTAVIIGSTSTVWFEHSWHADKWVQVRTIWHPEKETV